MKNGLNVHFENSFSIISRARGVGAVRPCCCSSILSPGLRLPRRISLITARQLRERQTPTRCETEAEAEAEAEAEVESADFSR